MPALPPLGPPPSDPAMLMSPRLTAAYLKHGWLLVKSETKQAYLAYHAVARTHGAGRTLQF